MTIEEVHNRLCREVRKFEFSGLLFGTYFYLEVDGSIIRVSLNMWHRKRSIGRDFSDWSRMMDEELSFRLKAMVEVSLKQSNFSSTKMVISI